MEFSAGEAFEFSVGEVFEHAVVGVFGLECECFIPINIVKHLGAEASGGEGDEKNHSIFEARGSGVGG